MKKLIFLFILAVAFVGFMPAQETTYPLWALAHEAALSGYAADGRVVTSDTVSGGGLRDTPVCDRCDCGGCIR